MHKKPLIFWVSFLDFVDLVDAEQEAHSRALVADALARKCHETPMRQPTQWMQLRHNLARLRAYFVSADTIAGAGERWPELFDSVQVTIVPSSVALANPLTHGCSVKQGKFKVDVILGRMFPAGEVAAQRDEVSRLQMFGLDKLFHDACVKQSFAPIVHAEVLVFDHIRDYLDNCPGIRYWNNLPYIGSSKPTCRLCSYYFDTIPGIRVRPTHGNLYSCWRLPDVYNSARASERDQALNNIISRIRKDVSLTMESKLPRGKYNDSSSFPTVPAGLKRSSEDAASLLQLSTEFGTLRLEAGQITQTLSRSTKAEPQRNSEKIATATVEEIMVEEDEVVVYKGRGR